MSTYYIFLITLTGIIGYLIILDSNVSNFIQLIPRIIKLNIDTFIWRIRLHPIVTTNRFSQWLMMRKYEKLIKEFDEQQNKTDSGT